MNLIFHSFKKQLSKHILKRSFFLITLSIILLGFLVYSNSFLSQFVFDDHTNIINNSNIREITDILQICKSRPSRFIANFTFALNFHFSALNPVSYNLVNLLIHILNAILVFTFVFNIRNSQKMQKIKWAKSKIIPFIISLFFLLHPVQTHAVNSISQRSTLLACFFYLLTLIFYLQSSRFFYLFSLFTFMLALFTKENSYTLPLAIILVDVFFLQNKKTLKKKLIRFAPFFFIPIIIYLITFLTPLRGNWKVFFTLPRMAKNSEITRQQYFFTQFPVIVKYLRLFVFPISLNADYDFPIYGNFFNTNVIMSLLLLVSLAVFALVLYKKNKIISFGIFFFFLTLSIESSLIPIKDVIFEHRTYLPSIGFFIAVTFAMHGLADKGRAFLKRPGLAAGLAAVLAIIFFSVLTYNRNKVWQTEYALWSDTVEKSVQKPRVHYNLAVSAYDIGKVEQAKKEFERTITLDSKFTDAYRNLGYISELEGDKNQALDYYLQGVRTDPKNMSIRSSLASFYIKNKMYDKAEKLYFEMLKISPKSARIYNDLGVLYLSQNKKEYALDALNAAVDLDPNFENALQNLANALFHFGESKKALETYQKILDLNPENQYAQKNLDLIEAEIK